MRKISTALVLLLFAALDMFAQPTVLYSSINSTPRISLTDFGVFRQGRLQANQTGNQFWAFHLGTVGSPDYSQVWRPNSSGNVISFGNYIPTSFANGAKYNTFGGGSDGQINGTQNGFYYTFNTIERGSADAEMQVLETSYNPTAISSVTQNPIAASVAGNNAVSITINLASVPSVGENVYVRYTTNGYANSTLLQATFVNAMGTVVLPCQSATTVVSYYVFSSNETLIGINSDVASYGPSSYDLATLNLNNNAGSNYQYTVQAGGTTWSGVLNTDWNNTANWSCGGVPNNLTDVSIPASLPRYPIITGTVNARNIDIASGGSVTVNTGGFFNLYGSVTNAGSFDLTNGTLKLDGAGPLSIAGSSFVNATVKNLTIGTDASLSNELKVTGTVSFSISTKTLTTNGNLTLISNASGTADIANTTGNTITGEVIIERFLPAKKAWRYLATPVVIATSPSINNSWREGEPVGTNTATGYGTRITGPVNMDEYTLRSSMKSYNMATNAFVEINNTTLANPIANEQGYFVFVRGDRGINVPSNAVGATTLRIKGELRTGNQIFNVNADKFQSVGNPYPSAIDFRTVTKSAQIVDAFSVWNPYNAGSYNVGAYENYIYDLGTGHYVKTPGGTIRDSIQSGEAIFIQNGDLVLNGSITIMETDKVGGSRLVSRGDDQSRPGVLDPTMEINLHAKNTDGSNFLADGVKLNFDNSFSNTLDNMDVRKVNNSFDNLAIKSNGKNLVVERRSNLLLVDTIFLQLTSTRIAPYRFEIDPSVLGNLQLAAFLKDKFLQTETPVSLTAVTNYNFDITADAGSIAADRFMIVFRQPVAGPLPVRFIDIAVTKNADKTNAVKWTVANEINMQQYEIERSDKGTNFVNIGSASPLNNTGGNYAYNFVDAAPLALDNYYRIKAISANGQIQYSAIVKLLADVKDASIAVNPNPVEGKKMQIYFNNKMGKYSIMLISNEGKTVFAQNMVVSNTNEIKVIELDKSVAKGHYQLIIQSAASTKQVLPLVIQ